MRHFRKEHAGVHIDAESHAVRMWGFFPRCGPDGITILDGGTAFVIDLIRDGWALQVFVFSQTRKKGARKSGQGLIR